MRKGLRLRGCAHESVADGEHLVAAVPGFDVDAWGSEVVGVVVEVGLGPIGGEAGHDGAPDVFVAFENAGFFVEVFVVFVDEIAVGIRPVAAVLIVFIDAIDADFLLDAIHGVLGAGVVLGVEALADGFERFEEGFGALEARVEGEGVFVRIDDLVGFVEECIKSPDDAAEGTAVLAFVEEFLEAIVEHADVFWVFFVEVFRIVVVIFTIGSAGEIGIGER